MLPTTTNTHKLATVSNILLQEFLATTAMTFFFFLSVVGGAVLVLSFFAVAYLNLCRAVFPHQDLGVL